MVTDTSDARVDLSLSPHTASASDEAIAEAEKTAAEIQEAVGVAGQRSTEPKPTHAEALADTVELLKSQANKDSKRAAPAQEQAPAASENTPRFSFPEKGNE